MTEEKTTKDTRSYVVRVEETLDLSSGDTLDELQQKYDTKEIEVLVKVGKAMSDHPKKALEALAEAKDLNGDVEVAAESALTRFPGISTFTKRGVNFGD